MRSATQIATIIDRIASYPMPAVTGRRHVRKFNPGVLVRDRDAAVKALRNGLAALKAEDHTPPWHPFRTFEIGSSEELSQLARDVRSVRPPNPSEGWCGEIRAYTDIAPEYWIEELAAALEALAASGLRYSSDDHSGVARSVSEIAQAHGLRATTAQELEAAFRRACGYITVTDQDGAVVAHVPQ